MLVFTCVPGWSQGGGRRRECSCWSAAIRRRPEKIRRMKLDLTKEAFF